MKKLLPAALAGWFCLCWISAADDVDLRLNGDFRGAAVNAALAPGWSASPGEGTTRVLPGEDHDEFAAEITAGAQSAKAIFSDLQAIQGNVVKLEAKIKGSGRAAVGIAAFDAAQKLLFTRTRAFSAAAWWSKAADLFVIAEPEVKFVQVVLSAEPGSAVAFADVEAEFKRYAVLPIPAPGQIQTPAVPAAQAAPASQQTFPAAPAAQPAQAIPAPPAPAVLPALIPEKRYPLSEVASTSCQATVPLSGEIDFELEEEASKGKLWSITSYDPAVCRVELEHDRDGVWPLRREQAEIELKGVARGTTTVLFSYPDGKSFQVQFTVR